MLTVTDIIVYRKFVNIVIRLVLQMYLFITNLQIEIHSFKIVPLVIEIDCRRQSSHSWKQC